MGKTQHLASVLPSLLDPNVAHPIPDAVLASILARVGCRVEDPVVQDGINMTISRFIYQVAYDAVNHSKQRNDSKSDVHVSVDDVLDALDDAGVPVQKSAFLVEKALAAMTD